MTEMKYSTSSFFSFAVAAMIASDGTLPDLPFTVREMGARALGQGTSRL